MAYVPPFFKGLYSGVCMGAYVKAGCSKYKVAKQADSSILYQVQYRLSFTGFGWSSALQVPHDTIMWQWQKVRPIHVHVNFFGISNLDIPIKIKNMSNYVIPDFWCMKDR